MNRIRMPTPAQLRADQIVRNSKALRELADELRQTAVESRRRCEALRCRARALTEESAARRRAQKAQVE